MKSLEKTFIYSNLNKSNALTQNISGLLINGQTLTKKELEEPFMVIMKNFKFPLKFKVMEAFERGDIELKMSPSKIKVPTCLPFVLTKKSERIVAVIAVDLYGSYDNENESVKIDPKKLYCMMESAYLAKICYEHSYQLASRPAIIANGSAIYAGMFARVLNKKYALHLNKTRYHNVLLLASKFFIINLLGGKDGDTTFNYALKNCPNGNLVSLQEINDMVDTKSFDTFDTFIKTLTRPELGLNFKELNTRNYLEAFINMYDATNLLSLEAFPYFLYNIISVVDGAYLNNQYVLEDIVGNYGAKLYNDIVNLDNDR